MIKYFVTVLTSQFGKKNRNVAEWLKSVMCVSAVNLTPSISAINYLLTLLVAPLIFQSLTEGWCAVNFSCFWASSADCWNFAAKITFCHPFVPEHAQFNFPVLTICPEFCLWRNPSHLVTSQISAPTQRLPIAHVRLSWVGFWPHKHKWQS